MNVLTLGGPCADYEHDLVELVDGSLGPERARVIRLHVESCPHCRAWQAEFAALDARLAGALPRPELSPDFEHRLRARLSASAEPLKRGELRNAADREYEQLLGVLGRGARRHALLDAVGSVAVTAGVLFAARGLLGPAGALLQSVEGPQQWALAGIVGTAIAAAALGWSAARGVLPVLRSRV